METLKNETYLGTYIHGAQKTIQQSFSQEIRTQPASLGLGAIGIHVFVSSDEYNVLSPSVQQELAEAQVQDLTPQKITR